MNNAAPNHDAIDQDPVWQLVEQSPMTQATGSFSDRVVRASRLEKSHAVSTSSGWWRAGWLMAPVAAAAAFMIGLSMLGGNHPDVGNSEATVQFPVEAPADLHMVELQAIAETEALAIASDHLDDFSDYELVSLMGF